MPGSIGVPCRRPYNPAVPSPARAAMRSCGCRRVPLIAASFRTSSAAESSSRCQSSYPVWPSSQGMAESRYARTPRSPVTCELSSTSWKARCRDSYSRAVPPGRGTCQNTYASNLHQAFLALLLTLDRALLGQRVLRFLLGLAFLVLVLAHRLSSVTK